MLLDAEIHFPNSVVHPKVENSYPKRSKLSFSQHPLLQIPFSALLLCTIPVFTFPAEGSMVLYGLIWIFVKLVAALEIHVE